MIKRLAIFLLIIVIVLLLFLGWLGYTRSGLQFAYHRLQNFLPGKLEIVGLEGKLFDDVRFKQLSYHEGRNIIRLEDVELRWNALSLIFKKVNIHLLGANKVDLIIFPVAHTDKRPFRIPFAINAKAVMIKSLHVQYNNQKYYFRDFFTSLKYDKKNLVLFDLNFPELQATIQNNLSFVKNLKIEFRDNKYIFSGEFQNQTFATPIYYFTSSGEFSNKNINSVITIEENNTRVFQGQFKINREPYLSWDIFINAYHFNIAHFVKDMSSNMSFVLKSNGEVSPNKKFANFTLSNVVGNLNHHPVFGKIDLAISPTKHTFYSDLTIGKNILYANGIWDNSLNIPFKISLPDLTEINPHQAGQFEINGKITGAYWFPNIAADFNLKNFKKDIKINRTLNFSGKLSSAFDIKNTPQKFPITDLQLSINNIYVQPTINARLSDFKLIGKRTTATFDMQSSLQIDNNNFLRSNISLPQNFFMQKQKTFKADIQANITNWNFINALLDEINIDRGRLFININATGSVYNPSYNGSVSFTNGQIKLINTNTLFSNIEMRGSVSQTNWLTLSLRSNAFKSLVWVDGRINLLKPLDSFDFKIRGNNLEVLNNQDYQIYASPNLTIRSAEDHTIIDGQILIPKAIIMPKTFGRNVVTLPSDVQFVETKETRPMPWEKFSGKVDLVLGNNVKFNSFGLVGDIVGQINIFFTPGSTTTAIGSFTLVNGRYTAYGTNLGLREGKLIFSGGNIRDPQLNVEATRTLNATGFSSSSNQFMPTSFGLQNEVTVGVSITGSVRNHKINLFSEPGGYSQSDILAMLLMGKAVGDLSKAGAQSVLQTASALNLGGGTFGNITQQIGGLFGLDSLGLGTVTPEQIGSEEEETSLTLGKKFSNRLFINYSFGLFDPVSIIQIRYLLTKHWSIQTQATTGNTGQFGSGIDIFYTIETDKNIFQDDDK